MLRYFFGDPIRATSKIGRLLARLGISRATVICIRQADAYRWPKELDDKMTAQCERCSSDIFFERKNAPFRKICNRCAFPAVWALGDAQPKPEASAKEKPTS